MSNLYLMFREWLAREEGQDLIEYAVLVFFIALIVIVVLGLVGNQVSAVFQSIVNALGGT